MNIIPIIIGPTSSGKTSLALEVCKKMGENGRSASIVSADSRQIYKHMDIGTGKQPVDSGYDIQRHYNKWEFDGIDIWGYDLVEPDKYYTAVDYAEFALPKIRELNDAQKATLIVGGTGFYIDILTGNSVPSKKLPDKKLRRTLENMELSELQQELTSLNPGTANRTDMQNKIRIIRAIERETPGPEKSTSLPYLDDVRYVYFGLTAPREYLYEKVDTWLETVWNNGLLDEVSSLLDMGYGSSPKLKGLVYKSAFGVLKGGNDENEAIQRAKYDLHAYIRRQMTWFKKNDQIEWHDITSESRDSLSDRIIDFF